eukprot:CAMPEP_0114546348 /NCGR_PEP_ID=MMETSP0114-20121206/3884_1 /TAXON_ID=31324 /ORGANISM="Goniomonas sp, Strain m" /LENGTH=307 /DNA_ID=CAMNT_0001730833 /DNA_START=13 /DNA_END=936 /DNA_ORIENTATION=+
MPRVIVNGGIHIAYETHGDPTHETILLVMGLANPLTSWHEDFCEQLASNKYHVIRFDNRDIGLSSRYSTEVPNVTWAALKKKAGYKVTPPYTLEDMARDAFGLLTALKIEKAHVVGVSMGGMIAQTMTILSPARVLSLCSIMSTPGKPGLPDPSVGLTLKLLRARPTDLEEHIEHILENFRIIGSPKFIDPDYIRARARVTLTRANDYSGSPRQLLAIMGQPDRSEALKKVTVPSVVIHGSVDQLVPLEHGRATADVLPGAELVILEDMGHDMPRAKWPEMIDAIVKNAQKHTTWTPPVASEEPIPE